MKMNTLETVAFVLVVVGALNWGLVGLLDLNLVDALLGGLGMAVVKIVYILVGLSGVVVLWSWYSKKK
jgi:uncharacterized membrane protein YuzA (DUF378 family)